MSLEDADETELVALKARYDALAARARARAGEGKGSSGDRPSGEQEELGDDSASP
jgi:hypothetical protein